MHTNGTVRTSKRATSALDRLPPFNLEAERGVIGSILLDPEVAHDVLPTLKADDFYRDDHQQIFRAIVELYEASRRIDGVTIVDMLRLRPDSKHIGDLELSEILSATPHAANASFYADIVRENSVRRDIITTATTMLRNVYSNEMTAKQVLAGAEKSIFDLSTRQTKSNLRHVEEILPRVIEAIEARRTKKAPAGLQTGFADLDCMTGGFHPGQLIIVAARPSHGKSALSWAFAEHAATGRGGKPALFASLEMTGESLIERALAGRAMVDGHRLRTGFGISIRDMEKVLAASEELKQAPIFVDDTPGQTMLQALSTARRVAMRCGQLGLYVFDYGQLGSSGTQTESRQEEVATIFRRLKWLARELEVPVVALSQLNRKVEDRPDHQPMLSDLRESGSIEQDADIVILLNRPERYDPNDQPGIAIADVAKNRNGATGHVKLFFHKEYTKFENLRAEDPPIEDF